MTNYLPLALFPILYFGAKFYYKEPIKKPHEMDFVTDIAAIEAESYVLANNHWFRVFMLTANLSVPPGTRNLHRGTRLRHCGNGW